MLRTHHFLLNWPPGLLPRLTLPRCLLQPSHTHGAWVLEDSQSYLTPRTKALLLQWPFSQSSESVRSPCASAFGFQVFPGLWKHETRKTKPTPKAPCKFEMNAPLKVYKNNITFTSQEQLHSPLRQLTYKDVWCGREVHFSEFTELTGVSE